MPDSSIQSPADYVPSRTIAFSDVDGTALLANAFTPLSVGPADSAA